MKKLDDFHERAQDILNINYNRKIDYYRCKTANEVGEIFATSASNGKSISNHHAAAGIKDYILHEIVHVLALPILSSEELLPYIHGMPPFINEGIAVALGGATFFSSELQLSYVKQLTQAGKIEPLEKLIDADQFWQLNGNVSYSLAGSFINFLIDTAGINGFKELYRRSISKTHCIEALTDLYDKSITEIKKEWVEYAMKVDIPEIKMASSLSAKEVFSIDDPR